MGFALVEPSKSGAALKRALVDVAAAKGSERLIFEADPVIGEGVERVPRPFARHPGGILDVDVALAAMALTGAERKRLTSIWADALAKAQPELEAAKEKWLEARGGEIAKARNVEPKEGRRIAEREAARFEAGELRDDFPIHLDSGEWVTVYQILSDPDRYRGARCWSLDETMPRPGVGFIRPYPSRGRTKGRQAARPVAAHFRARRSVFQAALGEGRDRAHRAAASRAAATDHQTGKTER